MAGIYKRMKLDWRWVTSGAAEQLLASAGIYLIDLDTLQKLVGDRGGTVIKVLCYKSEGRCFDPNWCHWNFSLTKSFRSHYGPGVHSPSNINEYQEYFMGVKTAGA